MKLIISSLFLILSFSSFAQSTNLENLKNKKQNILNQITSLQDSLYEISIEIEKVKPKQPIEIEPARSVARNGGTLKKIPHSKGEIVMELKGYTSLIVVGFEDYYYRVCVKDTCGYLQEMYVAKDIYVLKHRDNFFKKKKDREAKKKEEELTQQKLEWEDEKNQQNKILAQKRKEEEKRMIAKYGKEKVTSMKRGEIWIGMNEEQSTYSLGKPKDVNRSVGSWGVKEQWVYNGGVYLYFENGELTSWQD